MTFSIFARRSRSTAVATGSGNFSTPTTAPRALPKRSSLAVFLSILRLNLVLTYGIPPEFRGGVHFFILNRHTPSGQSRVYRVTHAVTYRWRSLPRVRWHRASKPRGSSERVLPWQVTMVQLICASLSHTHYWYEVGVLKVPYSLLVWLLGAGPPSEKACSYRRSRDTGMARATR